jgi:trigger factor
LAFVEGCKHAIEVSIPVDVVNAETDKVAGDFQKKVRLPGFRPGKAPLSMVRKNFEPDIRQKVVEVLIPRYLDQQFEQDQLKVVSRPDIIDVHYTPGEPLTFKAEFEVAPEIELGEYRGVEVPYHEPVVTDADLDKRIEEMRHAKATFANVDPRALTDGDFAVLSLESIAGTAEPVKSDELTLEIGGADTLPEFSAGLRGLSPEDKTEIQVTYPDDYGSAKLAGKNVTFRITVKGVRKKEVPELNDEFAQDMGDFRGVAELRENVRKLIYAQRELTAQQVAKNALVEKLVDTHDFPVPQAYIDRQIEARVRDRLHSLASEGVDVSKWTPDWDKMREVHGEASIREVKASLLLGKIAEREDLRVTNEEVDRQVEQLARREREPVPSVRKRLEENNGLNAIANRILTEKTLNLLFEQARKIAAPPLDEATLEAAAELESASDREIAPEVETSKQIETTEAESSVETPVTE